MEIDYDNRTVRLGVGERLANAGRQSAQLPWFARNVVIQPEIAPIPKFKGPTLEIPEWMKRK